MTNNSGVAFSLLFRRAEQNSMRGSRNLRQGVQVSMTIKSADNGFFSTQLFYRSQMVNFKDIYHFSRFQRGSNIYQGGWVQLFPGGGGGGGGSNCLFLIETHITCDFPGGGVRTPCPPPPSGSAFGTVSLLISGDIHDIEIQCEQQNVIYKGLGIFSLF